VCSLDQSYQVLVSFVLYSFYFSSIFVRFVTLHGKLTKNMRHLFTSTLIVLSLFLPSFEARPSEISLLQEAHCDPDLKKPTDDPYGYQLRGTSRDRCEGIYNIGVAANPLLIASMTAWFEDFDPAAGTDLTIEWRMPGDAGIHLRAYTLKHNVYYRMDSLRPAGRRSYDWQPGLLFALNLSKRDLGVVGWMSYPIGQRKRDLYLPLRIRQRASVGKFQGYQLLLLPGVELAEVFLSLAPLKPNGEPGGFSKNAQKLGYGYYPIEQPVPIIITEAKTPGVYYLKLSATLKRGGSTTTEIWFYHENI
jgi:hypothetical protein